MPKGIATSVAMFALALPFAARADSGGEDLFRAIGMPEIMEVMREEGIDYG